MISKQVNIRIEPELYKEITEKAQKEGLNLQDWIRNACRNALGQSIPGAVGRSEFEAAIASLTEEIEELKKLELAA